MISSRLQQRLLHVRCAHTPARSSAAAHTTQRRFAASSSPPPRQPPQPATPAARRQAAAPRSADSGTGTTARIQAEKEASRPAETADEYKTRYKSAARRWTTTVIALPILLVTSYYLFDRLALGHARKVLNHKETKRDD
ncbi:hypothetical protein MY11210_002871 [Beauveria gryllotalpidicola]